ncbi:MAG: hypothetical protein HW416_1193 [Chloroflexi bacterium]|nr:hypothetical protein [Chloroflexota bacterium]
MLVETGVRNGELHDAEFLRNMVEFLGWKRAARVVGWSVLLNCLSEPEQSVASKKPGRVTHWRILRDIRRFREYLSQREGGEPLNDAEFVLHRIGALQGVRLGDLDREEHS